jgi:hypothetical protein
MFIDSPRARHSCVARPPSSSAGVRVARSVTSSTSKSNSRRFRTYASTRTPVRSMSRTLDRAARCRPARRLTGDRGDRVDVGGVVNDGDPLAGCHRGDEQVRDPDLAVMERTLGGERADGRG